MRIGIDARFFGPEQKGLGRYSQKLIEHLEKVDQQSEHEYYVFLRKHNFDHFNPKNKRFKKVLAEYHWYGIREQLLFPLLLNKYKIDLMHFCHFNVPIFYRGRFLVTIHDLILFHFPTIKNTTLNRIQYFLKMFIYHFVIRSASRRAKKIITISNYAKEDIKKELKIEESRIIVTKEGFDHDFSSKEEDCQAVFKKYGIINPYILYVGNAYPHKNLERLCSAFVKVKEKYPDLELIIIGGSDYFFEKLKQYINNREIKGVIFPGFVSDAELDVFYRKAELFIFPSLYEGFGLPPLEAIAKEVAVVSSNRTSMPEVLGDAAQYFNPEDVDSIVENIVRVLDSSDKKKELIEKGRERLKIFSWGKMAQKTLETYNEILS